MQIYVLDESKGSDHMRLYIDRSNNRMDYSAREEAEAVARRLSEVRDCAQVRLGNAVLAEFWYGERA